MTRKSLTKKTRFEIFKRDNFRCQYCGANPLESLLEVDHIVPVAAGGDNDSGNLITSCFDCNRGKGDRSLQIVPESLSDKAKRIKESELQISEYRKILQEKNDRLESDVWDVVYVIFGTREETRKNWFFSIKKFIELIGLDAVMKAAEITVAARSVSHASDSRKFRYFCGVCWNLIRE